MNRTAKSETNGAVTVYDVARHAGVGKSAAAAVLNGSQSTTRVSEVTRQRIQQAALELGYRPNAVARGLARGRMHVLGVLFSEIEPSIVTNTYAVGVLEGITGTAAEAGYNVLLLTRSSKGAADLGSVVSDRSTDGLLVIDPIINSPTVRYLSDQGLPMVAIAARLGDSGVSAIDVDNALGARLAVEHLLGLGHRRIAHVMDRPNHSDVVERSEAYHAALAAAGLSAPAEYVAATDYTFETNYAILRRLMALPEPPTAFFTGNDGLAYKILEAARSLGLAVPGDISVVGFDDAPASAVLSLTTVRQPLAKIGEAATRTLLDQIGGAVSAGQTTLLEPELIVRDSTASPRA